MSTHRALEEILKSDPVRDHQRIVYLLTAYEFPFDITRALEFALIVATNQSGIARGYYSEADFRVLSAWIERQFADQRAPLTAIYYCPDHPDGIPPYRRESPMRKPSPPRPPRPE